MANPIFIPVAFAENGIKNPIQKALQPNQAEQEATWEKGWGNITFIPIESGGKAPLGQDFNGVFNAISSNIVHTQNGNRYKWSQDVVDNYGGYEFGAIVQSDDGTKEFRSILDNNAYNPNINPTNSWIVYSGVGSIPVATSTVAGVTRVLNNLTSTDVNAALSAAQGKALNDNKVAKADVVNTLTSTETQKPLSANQGRVLNEKFSFQNSRNTNGYVRLGDSGIVMQWGTVDYSSRPAETNVTVNFPTAFSNACLNVGLTRKVIATTLQNDGGALLVSQTRTNFIVNLAHFSDSNEGLRGFTWFAIGY